MRFYEVNGQRLPSVTTIVNCLAKPALENWMVGLAMDAAAEADDRQAAEALFGQRRWEKANLGTAVHDAIAAELRGRSEPAPEAVEPFLAQWHDFRRAHKVEPVMVETVVASARYGYAGRLDAIAEVDDRRILLDFKTGRLYRSVALQLAAYRFADVALPDYPDCALPAPIPHVDGCAVLALHADSYKLIDVEAGPRQLMDMRYLAQAFAVGQTYDRPLT